MSIDMTFAICTFVFNVILLAIFVRLLYNIIKERDIMFEKINYFNIDDSNHPLSLQISGISYCDGSYYIKRNSSEISVIEYIEKGTGTVTLDDITFTASAGDVYILPAGHRHEYYSSDSDPWVKKFLNIRGGLFPELLRQYSLEGKPHIPQCNVKELFDEIYDLSRNLSDWNSNDEFLDEISVRLHYLLTRIKRFSEKTAESDEFVKIKQYIDSNLDRIISNDELSALIFHSNDYLIKKFRERYSCTPYEYQLDRKITAAKRLLQYTILPVGDISRSLGYLDQHYFSSLFKQKCGISPLKYRKSKK